MNLTEKASYIKGLAEGLALDETTKEGKILAALLDRPDHFTIVDRGEGQGAGIRVGIALGEDVILLRLRAGEREAAGLGGRVRVARVVRDRDRHVRRERHDLHAERKLHVQSRRREWMHAG